MTEITHTETPGMPWFRPNRYDAAREFAKHHQQTQIAAPSEADCFVAGALWEAARQDQAAKTSGGLDESALTSPEHLASFRAMHAECAPSPPGGEQEAESWHERFRKLAIAKDYAGALAMLRSPASPVLDVEDQGASLEGLPRAKAHAPTPSQDGWVLVPQSATTVMLRAAIDYEARHPECCIGDVYRAMLAAAPQPPESGWRTDMETAPRDGTRFVAAQTSAESLKSSAGFINSQGEFECVDEMGNPLGIGFYPTMWMPIFSSQLPEGKV